MGKAWVEDKQPIYLKKGLFTDLLRKEGKTNLFVSYILSLFKLIYVGQEKKTTNKI